MTDTTKSLPDKVASAVTVLPSEDAEQQQEYQAKQFDSLVSPGPRSEMFIEPDELQRDLVSKSENDHSSAVPSFAHAYSETLKSFCHNNFQEEMKQREELVKLREEAIARREIALFKAEKELLRITDADIAGRKAKLEQLYVRKREALEVEFRRRKSRFLDELDSIIQNERMIERMCD